MQPTTPFGSRPSISYLSFRYRASLRASSAELDHCGWVGVGVTVAAFPEMGGVHCRVQLASNAFKVPWHRLVVRKRHGLCRPAKANQADTRPGSSSTPSLSHLQDFLRPVHAHEAMHFAAIYELQLLRDGGKECMRGGKGGAQVAIPPRECKYGTGTDWSAHRFCTPQAVAWSPNDLPPEMHSRACRASYPSPTPPCMIWRL